MTTYLQIRTVGSNLEAALLVGDADVEYVTRPLSDYRFFRWPLVEFLADLSLRYALPMSDAQRLMPGTGWDRSYVWKGA